MTSLPMLMLSKNYVIFLLTVLGFSLKTSLLWGQQTDRGKLKIGLAVTPLSSRYIGPFESLDGAGSLDSKDYFGFDGTVSYGVHERLTIETGLGFSRQRVTSNPAYNPSVPLVTSKSTLQLIDIPILAKYRLWKFLYANAGPILHVDVSGSHSVADKQSGIGFQLGLGGEVDLSKRLSLHINPIARMYSLIPFDSQQFHDRIRFAGIRLGVNYTLR